MTNLDSIFKSRDVTTSTKDHMLKAMVSPVVMCGCESWTIEGWELKNWYFQTVMLEKILASPLDSKEIKLVNLKGNQSWIFIGRTYVDAEAPILWPPDAESTHWKRRCCWERLMAAEGGKRGWDGWIASLTQPTWVWANYRGKDRKPGMLQSKRSQRVRCNWATEKHHHL